MFKNVAIGLTLVATLILSGCASVPMGPKEQDTALKQFAAPASEKAGVYIYRNTFGGQALKKTLTLDGKVIGETANKVYFHTAVTPGNHTLGTESEFSDNTIPLVVEGGKNYFVEQYIRMGVFVGGAVLKVVSEAEGKAAVLQCALAEPQPLVGK